MSRSFVTSLIIALILVLTLGGAANATVSQSDYDMLKTKIAAGDNLSRSDINAIIELHDAGMSIVDDWELGQLKEFGRIGERPIPARQPNNTLDEYQYSVATYNWFDISAIGTPNPLADDGGAVVTLPFNFSFYDVSYNSILLGSNGYIEFGGTGASSSLGNVAIPTAAVPNKFVAMFWDDLDPDMGNAGQIYTYHDVANSRFVIQFEAVQHYPSANPETFQCLLYSNGNILLQYETVSSALSCTVGIENETGTQGVQVCFNATGVDCPVNGLAILINQPDGLPNAVTNVTATLVGANVNLAWTNPTQDTNGNPVTLDAVQVWLGQPGVGTLLATLGGTVATYSHVNAPSGNLTYYVRAYNDPYYGAAGSASIVVGGASYAETFEATGGLWVSDNPDGWQWGVPTVEPAGAHGGTHCWETVLNADYPASACFNLTLDLDLTVSNAAATVEFWRWYDTEQSFDGCHFKVSVDNGTTWTLVTPTGGYPQPSVFSNPCIGATSPSWAGNSGGWVYTVIPIGQFNGQVPQFRFTFGSDPSVQYPGFAFDDMTIWGLSEPNYAPVSGTVSLDGGAGAVTAAAVHADGLGNPVATPAVGGAYTMPNVLVGARLIWATLAGYHDATTNVTLTEAGLTGVNLTLVRLDPPVPTGLEASVNNATGIVTLTWTASTDPLVDQYNIYRKLQADDDFVLIGNDTASPYADNLTVPGSGIYQYAISAVDLNVSTPVESDLTEPVTALYGELPPSGLAADGNFDNKIVLDWFEPGTPPEFELFYDDGTESDVDGLGWWGGLPSFGWMVAKYQSTAGPASVTRIKVMFTSFATAGDPIQVGVFADNGGVPTFEPLGVIDHTLAEPFDVFVEFPLDVPITFPNGIFWVGARQMTSNSLALAGDETTPQPANTFKYSFDAASWVAFEPGLATIPYLRCFAIGQFGALMEVEPAPIKIEPLPSVTTTSKTGKTVTSVEITDNMLTTSRDYRYDFDALVARGVSLVEEHAPNISFPVNRNHGRSLDDVLYYIVYRRPTGPGAFTDIGHPTTEHFENTGLAENVSYDYKVTAYYDNAEESGPTETVTKSCNMAPAAPTSLAGVASPPAGMFLTWINPIANDDGTPLVDLASIQIFRSGTLVGTVAAGVQQYTDTPPEPDQFYTWTVKAIDEVPNVSDPSNGFTGAVVSPWQQVDYEWVDIIASGTALNMTDDQSQGPFNIGFNVDFMGGSYSSLNVCSNGFVSFTSTSNSLGNTAIPSAAEPNAAIYPMWDDLNPASAGDVYYYSDVANERFVITWDGVPQYGATNPNTFQIVITSGGSVRLTYQVVATVANATIGVENAAGDEAIQILFNGAGAWTPTNSSAIEFWGGPSGEIAGLVREMGTNVPIAGADITVLEAPGVIAFTGANGMYSLGVEPGTYTVTAHKQGYCDIVNTNVVVEDNNTTTRNFSMLQPAGAVNVTSINMQTLPNINDTEQFIITNPGAGCAFEFEISADETWLSIVPDEGTVAPNGTQTITVTANVAGMAIGQYEATVSIDHNDADSPFEIPCLLVITNQAADDPHALPTEFAFFQNYPNPFNATTALSFDVPVEANVEIAIFNVMGQEVARPVNGNFPAGHHKIMYTADGLPSGMYLVKMTAGEFSGLQKMVLLK